jgi:hypothetical protein
MWVLSSSGADSEPAPLPRLKQAGHPGQIQGGRGVPKEWDREGHDDKQAAQADEHHRHHCHNDPGGRVAALRRLARENRRHGRHNRRPGRDLFYSRRLCGGRGVWLRRTGVRRGQRLLQVGSAGLRTAHWGKCRQVRRGHFGPWGRGQLPFTFCGSELKVCAAELAGDLNGAWLYRKGCPAAGAGDCAFHGLFSEVRIRRYG